MTLDNPNFNIMTLTDVNATLYPLSDLPGTGLLKEPRWKNLFPVKCFSQCLLSKSGASKLSFVTLLSMRIEPLILSVLRCDMVQVNETLVQLEKDSDKLTQVLGERTDGNRNVMHAAVFACAPTTNTANSKAFTSSDNRQASDIYASYGGSNNESSSKLTKSV